jgi:hypothetical protein
MLDPGTFKEVGSIAGKASYDAIRHNRLHPRQLRVRARHGRRTPRRHRRRRLYSGADPPTPPLGPPKMSEETAAQFRMPIIRLIEGSGGGGSVKTIETTGRQICLAD